MFQFEVLICKGLGPVYACTASAISKDEIASLDHKILDLFQEEGYQHAIVS